MKFVIGKKLRIWLMAGLSIFGVTVAAVSTAAWFEVESQPITTDVVTSTPNLDVQNADIYSYKISHEVDSNTGFINYGSTSIQKTKGNEIDVDNGHQAGEDADFNVPSEGIGYYLVKKNEIGTYTFTYFGNSMSWKLNKIDGATRYYHGSVELEENDELCVKSYDFDNHKTQITTQTLNSCSHGGTRNGNIVTVSETNTYNVWLTNTSGSWDLSLETVVDIDKLNVNNNLVQDNGAQNVERKARRNAGGTETDIQVYLASSTLDSYNNPTVEISVNIGDGGTWRHAWMTKTNYSYHGISIWSGKAKEKWGGVDAFYFDLYENGVKQDSDGIAVYTSWKTTDNYSGKLYVEGTGWITYSTDSYNLSIVGSGTFGNWDADTSKAVQMESGTGTDKYKKENLTISSGSEFKIANLTAYGNILWGLGEYSSNNLDDKTYKFLGESGNNIVINYDGSYSVYITSSDKVYLKRTLTINYNANGGTVSPSSKTVAQEYYGATNQYGTSVIDDVVPTRDGYTFAGWWTDSSGGTQITSTSSTYDLTADQTLYAHWTPKSYKLVGTATNGTVTFYSNSGRTTKITSANYGDTIYYKALGNTGYNNITTTGTTTLNTTNFTFANIGTAGTNATFNAGSCTAKTKSVTFNANGGTGGATKTLTYASSSVTAPTPTRTGYTFEGWNNETGGEGANTYSSSLTQSEINTIVLGSDSTLYAIWTPKIYAITLNNRSADSGYEGTPTIYEKYNVGYYSNSGGTTPFADNTIVIPQKDGYFFGGYYSNPDGTGTQYIDSDGLIIASETAFTSVATIYAKWTPGYTVSFEMHGHGSPVSSQGIISGGKATEPSPAPTATGYTFGGWYKEDTFTNAWNFSTDTVTAATTLHAKWTPVTFTISYNANSGSGSMSSSSLTYDSAGTLSSNGFTKLGYTFIGWATSAGGAVAYAPNALSLSDSQVNSLYEASPIGGKTLYAKWSKDTYTISYDGLEDATITANPTSYQVDTASFTLNNPTKKGYTFKGWSGTDLTGDTNKSVTITVGSVGDREYLANWTPNKYTISLENYSATTAGTEQIYELFDDGYYLDSACISKKMATNANGITIPEKTGYTFGGYWTGALGTSVKYIDENGKITSTALSNTNHFYTTGTLYAKWTPKTYTIHKEVQTYGTITTSPTTGTFASALTISWSSEGADGYNYSLTSVDVYTAASEGGAHVVGTITSGSSTTYTMTGTYYTDIYIRLVYSRTSKILTITLDRQSGSGGTGTIYEKYNVGYYSDSGAISSISSIEIPTRSGYVFGGYYTSTGGGGTNIIDSSGSIIGANTQFTTSDTIYALWKREVYFYDVNNWWTTGVQAHAWKAGSADVDVKDTAGVSYNGHKLYTMELPDGYTNLCFFYANGNGETDVKHNEDQTIDLTYDPAHPYFVMTTGGDQNTKKNGAWYNIILNGSTNTYYYFDNATSKLLGEDPKAYAWINSTVSNAQDNNAVYAGSYGGVYGLENGKYSYRNANWNGVSMTKVTGDELATFLSEHTGMVDDGYLWKIELSKSYDRLILSGNSDQTVDISINNANNGKIFVINGGTDDNREGVWANKVYDITLKTSYFITGIDNVERQSTLLKDTMAKAFRIDSDSSVYSPDVDYGSKIKTNASDGILYFFTRSGTTTSWYTAEGCSSAYVPAAVTTSITLYAKYVTDLDSYYMFYIDASTWGASYLDIKNTGQTETWMRVSDPISVIAPHLFRIILPNNEWNFQATYESCAVSGAVILEERVITHYVTFDNNSASSEHTWRSLSAVDIGTAVIHAYEGGKWVEKATMSIGDIEHYGDAEKFSNFFIYEQGLRLEVGTKFKIVYTQGGSYSSYDISSKTFSTVSDYHSGSIPKFLNQTGDLTTATYTGKARFNFYITNDMKLSVAMVPDYGNGFYIMKYFASYGLENFINGSKMNSTNSTSANYDGYYIPSQTSLFIRSYIDGVDTLYDTWDNTSIAAASMDGNGIITINSAGYYNITVTNGTVKVVAYAGVSEAFKLNPLDTTRKTTRADIKYQKTTLFIEVPFYCNNKYASTITLSVANPTYEFVGVGLYVTGTQLTTSNIYNTLTANSVYNNLTKFASAASTEIANLNGGLTSIAANQAGLFYAYIIIDYLPTEVSGVSYTNFESAALLESKIGYFLVGTQV